MKMRMMLSSLLAGFLLSGFANAQPPYDGLGLERAGPLHHGSYYGGHFLQLGAILRGASEVPPVETDTIGRFHMSVHPEFGSVSYELIINGANGVFAKAGAHVHCGAEGENGPAIAVLAGEVPGGLNGRVVVAGELTKANLIDESCGTTVKELVQSIKDEKVFINVHSEEYPAGVVRGQLFFR